LAIFRLVEGDLQQSLEHFMLFPSTYSGVPAEKLDAGIAGIEAELEQQVAKFENENRPKQAERIDRRTQADVAALRVTGTCRGIQNYSRHFDNRDPGMPPSTLMDYFPANYLTIIDESHNTVNQIKYAGEGPKSNKNTLVRNAFRLPSAADNRPLTLEEFEARLGPVIYVSATPGPYELAKAEGHVVEQIVRPTFIVDPTVDVVSMVSHTEHLLRQIRERIAVGERTLVTTCTKRHAEELAASIREAGIACGWLHQDLKGNARVAQLRRLRQGHLNVLVGVNLLREGIDLPEVSLVAILDADKGGFLRSERSLIQTIGRTARHVNGKAILYADRTTDAMQRAITETNRRREIQLTFNRKHRRTPQSIQTAIQ
jgi:excinuclease ABC subunit B